MEPATCEELYGPAPEGQHYVPTPDEQGNIECNILTDEPQPTIVKPINPADCGVPPSGEHYVVIVDDAGVEECALAPNEAEVLGTTIRPEGELAHTGNGTDILTGLGIALAVVGTAALRKSRRITHRHANAT